MNAKPQRSTGLSDAEIAQMIAARPGLETLRESGRAVTYLLAKAAQDRGADDRTVAATLGQAARVTLRLVDEAEALTKPSI